MIYLFQRNNDFLVVELLGDMNVEEKLEIVDEFREEGWVSREISN